MPAIRVHLLGAFGVAGPDAAPLQVETRKARALLAVLVMARGRAVPRERLADMLWGRAGTRQSLASLSQALYSLRRALEPCAPDALKAGADAVAIDPQAVTADALELEDAAAQGTDGARAAACTLYSGPFLEDLAIETEEGFAEWRRAEQARLEDLAVQCATDLAAAWEAAPEAADPAVVDRLLALDPYSEPGMRLRLRLLSRAGRPAAALQEAERFSDRLRADLGIAPSAAFDALVADLRRGEAAPAVAPGTPAAPRRRPGRAARLAGAALLLLALALGAVQMLRAPGGGSAGMRLLVLPFEAGEGVAAELARGFGDDLSTELVRRTGLDVLSRESGRLLDEAGIARSGATHVLRGRLRREADGVRLNVWIVDRARGAEVWASRFDGDAGALQAFRDRVVAAIADGVDLAFVPPADPPRPELPPEAVPAYLRGLSQLHSGTPEGNAAAIATLAPLAEAHPDANGPMAGLVLAHARVAFGGDAFARAARLNWREGYLELKRLLARTDSPDADILATRANLALRRRDFAAAETFARRALRRAPAHAGATATLAEVLALAGDAAEAATLANRAVLLAPATPSEGYAALALARFRAGAQQEALDAARTAAEFASTPPPRLLALIAAAEGALGAEGAAASVARFRASLESRPWGAARLGPVEFVNPRANTWARPDLDAALALFAYRAPEAMALLRSGLVAAGLTGEGAGEAASPMTGEEIRALLWGRRIAGPAPTGGGPGWSQVRTEAGDLFQTGVSGPLPAAREGRSRLQDARLCDSWLWRGTRIESCQQVLRAAGDGGYALVGEPGTFPFRPAE